MTDSPLPEILAAGEHALEYTHGRLDELTVQEIVDIVGRAVLHAAAEKIRTSYGKPRWSDDEPEYAYGVNHATHDAADLIDPAKQEQP